jgi:hypothetical protein
MGFRAFLRLMARCVRSMVARLPRMSPTSAQLPNRLNTDLNLKKNNVNIKWTVSKENKLILQKFLIYL